MENMTNDQMTNSVLWPAGLERYFYVNPEKYPAEFKANHIMFPASAAKTLVSLISMDQRARLQCNEGKVSDVAKEQKLKNPYAEGSLKPIREHIKAFLKEGFLEGKLEGDNLNLRIAYDFLAIMALFKNIDQYCEVEEGKGK